MTPSLEMLVSADVANGVAPETSDDTSAIEALLDAAFPGDRLARAIYRLRLGAPVEGLSLVYRDQGRVVASLRFWAVEMVTEGVQSAASSGSGVLLGPLAVVPHLRGRGFGRALISDGLERAEALGMRWCLVSGPASYYQPFGFEPAEPHGVLRPGDIGGNDWQIRSLGRNGLPVLGSPCEVLPRRSVRPDEDTRLGGPSPIVSRAA